MVRVFYINVKIFFEFVIDFCFVKVFEYCKIVINRSLNNFFFFDIMGCIYEK